MKIGIRIQARMNSRRLPGKVLAPILGKPMLQYVIERVKSSEKRLPYVVMTSQNDADDSIAEFCQGLGVPVYRGSLDNVAERMSSAAVSQGFDAFVRVSGDSPLLDQRIISRAVDLFESGNFDLVTNISPRTFPKGQSVEVIRTSFFKRRLAFISDRKDQEHVTSAFYQNPDQVSIRNIEAEHDNSQIQLSVDTEEDRMNAEAVFSSMRLPHWDYDLDSVLRILQSLNPGSVF